jgi:hypothetical protein
MYTRELNETERAVLNHLVELCCEAYWREATHCRICFEQSQLLFSAQIDSDWKLIEKEEISLADYNEIVHILQGIFEPVDAKNYSVNNRIVTVTLDSETGRPIMNLWLSFNGGKTDLEGLEIELKIEDLVEKGTGNDYLPDDLVLDSNYIN